VKGKSIFPWLVSLPNVSRPHRDTCSKAQMKNIDVPF